MLIPGIHLKAALQFRGQKDLRKYLNGVCFLSEYGHTVATDGHRIVLCETPKDYAEQLARDVSRAVNTYKLPDHLAPATWHDQPDYAHLQGELILDIPSTYKPHDIVDVRADGTLISYKTTGKSRSIKTGNAVGGGLSVERVDKFEVIDGHYPNYQDVVPARAAVATWQPQGVIALDADYLAAFAKFLPAHTPLLMYRRAVKDGAVFRLTPAAPTPPQEGKSAPYIDPALDGVQAVIMPVRVST